MTLLPRMLIPASFEGELAISYATRIDNLTAAPDGHLWALANASYRRRENLKAGSHVPYDATELELFRLCRSLCGASANGLALLGDAPQHIAWFACLMCTSRAIVRIHPDQSRLVCPVHHVWTGPTVSPARVHGRRVPAQPSRIHSQEVANAIVKAAERIHGSVAPELVAAVALRRAASAVRGQSDEIPFPEDLPTAAAILDTVQDTEVVRAVCTYSRPYSTAYKVVARKMEQAGNPSGDAGIDQAWLMLRWTAAAARFRWAGEWNTEDPAPLIGPIKPKNCRSNTRGPFTAYLDCVRTQGREDIGWWHDNHRQTATADKYLCSAGHVLKWRSKRTTHGPCGLCSGRLVIAGYNSVADFMPWLAAEWDPNDDSGHTPWTVRPSSNHVTGWICPKGHHYPASYCNRVIRGSGCPHCARVKIFPGEDDLATTHPDLARLWDPDAGNAKTPQEISAGNSRDIIVWRCPRGHSFKRTPANLVEADGRCQTCTGRILIPGVNDLATLRPDVAAQWHPYLNGELTADKVKPGSGRVVWWLCPNGHKFEERISYRCSYPRLTCKVETGKKVVVGVSDLATLEPCLVLDWDYERNGFGPHEVVPGNLERYWTCRNGHTQRNTVANRRRTGGCTKCPPAERALRPQVRALTRFERWPVLQALGN